MMSELSNTPSGYSNSTSTGTNDYAPLSYSSAVTAGINGSNATPAPSYASVAAGSAAPPHHRVETDPTAEGPSAGARILVPEKKKIGTLLASAPAKTPVVEGSDGGRAGSHSGTSHPAKNTSTTTESSAPVDNITAQSNLVDQVPRTPKFPTFILDPAHNSILAEVLFVTVGTVALGAAIFLGYRFYKNR